MVYVATDLMNYAFRALTMLFVMTFLFGTLLKLLNVTCVILLLTIVGKLLLTNLPVLSVIFLLMARRVLTLNGFALFLKFVAAILLQGMASKFYLLPLLLLPRVHRRLQPALDHHPAHHHHRLPQVHPRWSLTLPSSLS